MDNSDFIKLMAAKKLNDSVYQGLVYRTYSIEPICGCTKTNVKLSSSGSSLVIDNCHTDSSVNFVECPRGCKNLYCSNLRGSSVANNTNNERIRVGGGGGRTPVEQKYRTNTVAIESESKKYSSLCQCGSPYISISSRFIDYSPETFDVKIDDLNYKPMRGCWCLGVEERINKAPMNKLDNRWKNLHFEIERLTRAFEDAQKFVDSLGKGPGMASLGLTSSTQSLYFRANGRYPVEQSLEIINKNDSMQSTMVNPRYGGLRNSYIESISSTSPWIEAMPITILMDGRGTIVREALLAHKQDVNEEGEETIESGKSPEINCKSEHAKIINYESSIHKIEDNEAVDRIVGKFESRTKHKNNEYRGRRKGRRISGHTDDEFFKSSRGRKWNYVYFAGDSYPGSYYGHKNCSERHNRVPANMGWLWTQYQPVGRLKPRVGWRPGAISRRIREIIRETKAEWQRNRRRPSSVPSTGMQGKKFETRSYASLKIDQLRKLDEKGDDLEPPPTLHIQRQSGTYYISMYPIKQEKLDAPKLEESIKPLQFIIPKKSDDTSAATSSTASDIDIEFSPPAALNRYRKKPNVIHVEIQVNHQDIIEAFKLTDSIRKEAITEVKVKKKKRKRSKQGIT